MAKVVVTGGAGFIGSHLCERFVARGDEVWVIDDFSSGKRSHLRAIEASIHVIDADCATILDYEDALSGVDIIVHLAALISGYESLSSPDAYVSANISTLLRVLELAKKNPGCHIVFASSSTVYGHQAEAEMHETTPPNPLTMYALTKLSGEHLLAMYAALYGYTYSCARLFNVYGPRQSPDHPYANVTCKFSHAAATDGQVKLYGTGAQSRDFVYIDDVVDALVLISAPTTQSIYNVGTGSAASIRALLDTCSEVRGTPLDVEHLPPWPNDIHKIQANTDRIRKELGFVAKVPFQEGLRKTIEWFRGETQA